MASIKFLPGQVHTGKVMSKGMTTRQVGDKSVLVFKMVIGTKIKNGEGKYVPKMKKDQAGNDKEVAAFVQFEAWGDAAKAKIQQAIDTERCMTVIEYDIEENNYEKDGRTIYSDKRTVKFVKNYVFESSEWQLLDNPVAGEGEGEEMPF